MSIIKYDKLKVRQCPNCGGRLEIDIENEVARCQYCASEFEIELTKELKQELLRKKKIEEEEEKEKAEKRKEKLAKEEARVFRSGPIFKAALVITLVFLIFAFHAFPVRANMAACLAVIQTILMIIAIFMGMQIGESGKKNHMTVIAIALILIIPTVSLYVYERTHPEMYSVKKVSEKKDSTEEEEEKPAKIKWSELKLGAVIPELESAMGKINTNEKDHLELWIKSIDTAGYEEYFSRCKEKGFTVDEIYDEYGEETIVFNKEGYRLKISHNEEDKRIELSVEAPIKLEATDWPRNGLAKRIPAPPTKTGLIEEDETGRFGGFVAYAGNMSFAKYKEFVSDCIDAGFDVEYDRDKYHFSAKDREKYDITLEYYGNNIVHIDIGCTWVDFDDEE